MAFRHPLAVRYASKEMIELWSDERRYRTWRRVWLALAEAEHELGLPIDEEQLQELRAHVDDLNLERAAELERQFRHDVMAHVHAYGEQCPRAKPIIHLGATSAFVTDNADLILVRDALRLLRDRLVRAIDRLARFAQQYRDLPCLGWTHLQPAQPTTVGKRATLWCWDFLEDLRRLETFLDGMRCRGAKGATGTQASYLTLFEGDHDKVRQLDELVAAKLGFRQTFPVTGQTYPRKTDLALLELLASIATSAHKFAVDLRLLASRRELEEPWGERQIGSSAMPYKRNPMRSERICSLARYLFELPDTLRHTAANQWLERSLDDSAVRRIVLPEAFLAADAILRLLLTIVAGLQVNEAVVRANLAAELPFLITEAIMMAAVKAGADRQEVHEKLRRAAMEVAAAQRAGQDGNDLIERLQQDPLFAGLDWDRLLDPRQHVGRAPQQVDEFVQAYVEPMRRRYAPSLGEEDSPVEV